MAIDTAFKRRSAAAARRMPWMRRFGIAPDGTIDQGDRQAKAWVYGGILAEAPNVPSEGPMLTAGPRSTMLAALARSTMLTASNRSTMLTAEQQ